MAKSNHQTEIIRYLLTVDQATIGEIYDNTQTSYHCNPHKHLGEVLSRMVKNHYIERVPSKRGTYRIKDKGVYSGGLFN